MPLDPDAYYVVQRRQVIGGLEVVSPALSFSDSLRRADELDPNWVGATIVLTGREIESQRAAALGVSLEEYNGGTDGA